MWELFLLIMFSAMAGVVFRAYFDEKYNSGYYFWQSIWIGIALATLGCLNLQVPVSFLTVKDCLGNIIFYFMAGWVFSDIADSFAFILNASRRKRRRHG